MQFIESRLEPNTKKFLVEEMEDYIDKDLEVKIEVFDKFLCLSKEDTEFNDLDDRIASSLNEWAQDKITSNELLKDLSVTEQFIKSIIYLVDKTYFDKIMSTNEAFKNAIIYIGLTKLNNYGNLNLTLNSRQIAEGKTLEDVHRPPQLYWARAYTFRNEDAHACKKYTHSKCLAQIFSILYVLIESAWKFRKNIESLYFENVIFNGINKNEYYDKIIKEYENNNFEKSFVIMNSSKVDSMKVLFPFDKEEEEDKLITCLNIIDTMTEGNNYVKIIGEAGLGKSRVMKQLQYNDAKQKKTFPVYVELKELSDFKISINELISEKSGLDQKSCSILMEKGGMNLYLDGVNEILCSDKMKRVVCSKIDELASKYPKTKILVSDRESSQVSISMDIPTFLLCKLDEPMIQEFVYKNSNSMEIANKIIAILEESKYLYKIVQTPFLLKTFIYLVQSGGYQTSITNENQLIHVFVKNLIYREAREKKEIRADKIEMLLTYLFIDENPKNEERLSFSKHGILATFRKCKEYYGFEIDTDEILEIIVQMGFLERIQGDEFYAFANEFYEVYFASKAKRWELE